MSAARCYLNALGMVNALGADLTQIARGLALGDTSGMVAAQFASGQAMVGQVRHELFPELPAALAHYSCINNRLLLAALAQIEVELDAARHRYGPARIGVVLGTSTSGVATAEVALAELAAGRGLPTGYDYRQMEIGAPAPFVAQLLGVTGPAYTVSTACTSSAKAFASARRLLQLGIVDAVVVGGADTLCELTVGGFAALESTSAMLTNPLSRNRAGINIGEGAAVFLMTRDEAAVALLGVGESSDAHHISAPEPQGLGAEIALRAALCDAGLSAEQIDYVNLHATATLKNDAMESRVMARLFPDGVATSGTKPLTGHLLGAAGATELAFCWLLLNGALADFPPHIWDGAADPELPVLDLVKPGRRWDGRGYCMSNSFAFGGSNASLIIGR